MNDVDRFRQALARWTRRHRPWADSFPAEPSIFPRMKLFKWPKI